jgi:ribosome biogenesis protein BMS1
MSAADILGPKNKKHSSSKGKKKTKGDANAPKRKNTKAFNVANVVSAKRNMQRNLDKAQQKEVVPLLNREESIPPPSLIVVMGPKGVGKTTLIRSLVKIYTGQNITNSAGPITVISGNKKRLTFFECPLDLYSMTDLAKVADLVLLMIDASYGLEMETFEYLNLLQLHGFPKVVGILTHLDRFKSMKSLQSTKKEIKHRFWTEIYKGAKLFDFMGVVNNKYRKHEVKRLSLHISRLKYRPLVWRNAHPYLLIDRVEDVTPLHKRKGDGRDGVGENDDSDNYGEKEVTLYGFIRGSHLKTTTKVHLIGAGDFDISSITALPDPCPLKNPDGQQLKLSRKKDHLLYAPMANVGRVSMDRDSLYIDLKQIHYTKKDQLYLPDQGTQEDRVEGSLLYNSGTPMDLLRSMQDVKVGVDQQLKKSRGNLELFANSGNFGGAGNEFEDEYDNDDDDEDEDDHDLESDEENDEDDDDNANEDEFYSDDEENNNEFDDEEGEELDEEEEEGESENSDDGQSDSEDEFESRNNGSALVGKNDFQRQTSVGLGISAESSRRRQSLLQGNQFNDIMKEIYGNSWVHTSHGQQRDGEPFSDPTTAEEGSEEEEDFFVFKENPLKSRKSGLNEINRLDSSRYSFFPSSSSSSVSSVVKNVNKHSLNYDILKSRFVTGGFKKKIAGDDENGDEDGSEGSEGNSAYEGNYGNDDESDVEGDFEDLETGEVHGKNGKGKLSEDDQEAMNEEIDKELREMNARKKALFKAKFDKDYDQNDSVSFINLFCLDFVLNLFL